MEINTADILKLRKLAHCKVCKNDTFMVKQTGTDFILSCTLCQKEKTIPASKIKLCVKEVVSTTFRPQIIEM